jgi:hypothetical protein
MGPAQETDGLEISINLETSGFLAALFIVLTNKEITTNSWLLVHRRTTPAERQPVGEVSANFCGEWVLCYQPKESLRQLTAVFRTETLTFHSSNFTLILAKLNEPRPKLTTSQKIP